MNKKIKYLSQSGVFTKIVLPVILVVILAIIAWMTFKNPGSTNDLTIEEVKANTEEFINSYLMSPGTTATVTDIKEEYGLFKLQVDIVNDVVESYVTKDGKVFFPQAFYVDEMKADANTDEASAGGQEVAVEIPKNDKPTVELFVMSHCPFGTQIEKGILPVVDALGDTINFELKFVDYVMHGEVEINEQITQRCISKEQKDKFLPYLKCFLVEGDSPSCLAEVNVNEDKLNSCFTATDSEFKITENFKNNIGYNGNYPGFNIDKADNTKYGVGGSPALIINETDVPSARDPQSLLNSICSAFENAPEECSTSLSTQSPASGFGTGTAAAAPASAECN